MHNYVFDPETNGILLLDGEINPVACKEPRPVYAEEMNLLGFDSIYHYSRECDAPLLWSEQRSYIYKGVKLAKLTCAEFVQKPEIQDLGSIFANEMLAPCDVPAMLEKNRGYIDALADASIERVRKYYAEYKDKANAVWVSFSGGKDSMVLLDIVQRALPHDAFKVFFTDTHMELPDTYDYIDRIRVWCTDRNIDFIVCQSDMLPEDSWHLFGPPASTLRWCCSVHKTAPQLVKAREIYGQNIKAFSMVGVRASESLGRSKYDFMGKAKKHNGEDTLNVILDWNSAEVWLYLYMRKLPVNPAYRKGNTRVGCILCPGAGGTKLKEYIARQCYPDTYNRFYQYLKDTYDPQWLYSGDVNDPRLGKIWCARKNGDGLLIPCSYEDEHKADEWIIKIKEFRTDWHEWIKTIGILQNDKSPYQVKFKTGVYSFDVTITENGTEIKVPEQYTKEGKSFVKMLKQVFRKAACCVMCRVCEADCPFGCLKMKDGKITISENCHHCSRCHRPVLGCHVYHSTCKRRNGRFYYLNHWERKE